MNTGVLPCKQPPRARGSERGGGTHTHTHTKPLFPTPNIGSATWLWGSHGQRTNRTSISIKLAVLFWLYFSIFCATSAAVRYASSPCAPASMPSWAWRGCTCGSRGPDSVCSTHDRSTWSAQSMWHVYIHPACTYMCARARVCVCVRKRTCEK